MDAIYLIDFIVKKGNGDLLVLLILHEFTSTKNGLYAIDTLCHLPSVTFRSDTNSTAFEPLPTRKRNFEFTISNAIKSAALLYSTMPTASIVFISKFQLSCNKEKGT